MPNPGQTRRFLLIGALVAVVAVTAVVVIRSGPSAVQSKTPASSVVQGTERGLGTATPAAGTESPGTGTPAAEPRLVASGTTPKAETPAAPTDGSSPGYGTIPGVRTDAGPQVAKVVEALQTGKHPERLSALIPPPPFDRAAWEKDPSVYLSDSAPGRAFQPAQPGDGVPRLRFASSAGVVVEQGQVAELAAETAPGAPVSFTILHGGIFTENSLSSVTVRADERGIAKVHYQATPGVIDRCDLLAASPMASGQLRYRLFITDANHPFIATANTPISTTPKPAADAAAR